MHDKQLLSKIMESSVFGDLSHLLSVYQEEYFTEDIQNSRYGSSFSGFNLFSNSDNYNG